MVANHSRVAELSVPRMVQHDDPSSGAIDEPRLRVSGPIVEQDPAIDEALVLGDGNLSLGKVVLAPFDFFGPSAGGTTGTFGKDHQRVPAFLEEVDDIKPVLDGLEISPKSWLSLDELTSSLYMWGPIEVGLLFGGS